MAKGWYGQKRKHSEASKRGWKLRKMGRTGLTLREGVSPDYYRPISELVTDEKKFVEDFKALGGKRIGSGVYRKIQKSKNSPTGYEMNVFSQRGKILHTHIICNKDGSIPERQAILRLMDVESGIGSSRRRNLFIDLSETAEVTYKKDAKGNWKWVMNPNRSDLEKIDTTDQDFNESLKGLKTKGQKRSQRGIVILARSNEEEIDMRKRIGQAFTQKEQKEMGLVFVSVTKPSGSGSAGEYWYSADPPQVIIDPKYNTSDVLIHELIHHHRAVSKAKGREGALAHIKNYQGKDRDLEESMTEAESVTREKPLDKIQSGTGYYHFIDDKKRAIIEDRELLTKYDEAKHGKLQKTDGELKVSDENISKLSKKNIKGLRAVKSVRENYPKTNISKLKIKGKVEAIDTFHQYEKEGVKSKIHSYNPKAKSVNMPGSTIFRGEELYEWKDGKKVKIR